jgi:hypothetical protein
MTLDERLEALVQTAELLTHEIQDIKAAMVRLDMRERTARWALLEGITAYLKALSDES